MWQSRYRYIFLFVALLLAGSAKAEDDAETVEQDLGAGMEGSRTDDNVVAREEEAIKLDGLNVAQIKEMREKAEKHVFQAEVNRMMKLIINSLYRNKEIFLRELISNASDALDKIRLLSLTDKEQLETNPELVIRIKADKDNHILHITDTGIGMTKLDLVNNLGTIAKSGTSEFFSKLQESESADQAGDLIGQFGVGFYSAFLVADSVVVTSKHNSDKQHIWESDSAEFSVVEDPRGDTLKRGTTVSLHLKEEAYDFVEVDTVKNLVKKYSQFINFPIYLWESKTEEVEEPLDEDEAEPEDKIEEDEDGKVEEEKEDKPKTKKVSKTTWDWTLVNDAKPIWTRKPADIEDSEYDEFYKTLSKDSKEPLAKTHFVAEGEVTFKSLLFVPEVQPSESFNKYGTRTDNIKLYVRRVFITDDFQDMMPNYLSFIRGVVDSDDLPLNVSRENLQQHKLLKVIKKKLVRKTLDMIKKMEPEDYEKFWKEYSTNIKLGAIEDSANRTRLAKLLRFLSSASKDKLTSLSDYVERMKEKQEHIYYMAGASRAEVENSPFVERLIKKGYEVMYLTEAIDEYAINAIPEFEGKKFQNVAKEGLTIDEGEGAKERMEELKKLFEPLTKWLSEEALKDEIVKAEVGERLSESPCALVSSRFGWTANMQRIVTSQTHSKSNDVQRDYYLSQKKTLELNPRHPLIKELLKRVEDDPTDESAKNIAVMMYHTATLRSGYMLKDTVDFSKSVEEMMRQTLGIPLDEPVEEEPELEEEEADEDEEQLLEEEDDDEDDAGEVEEMHDEL
ncbi:endoplasmin-like isoform X1 [Homarus americanus]|uniref:endoplasmin-like isoform X1 n=1 Tax=Homarus americanus TaxID=6706 RepID=UPI001C4967F9|nr:endoplasmin-like isoform X1 [Homarus americanus]